MITDDIHKALLALSSRKEEQKEAITGSRERDFTEYSYKMGFLDGLREAVQIVESSIDRE